MKQKGPIFIKAAFIDGRIYYSLDVDELNQGLAGNPFQQLKQQWEPCLAPPIVSPTLLMIVEMNDRLKSNQRIALANLEATLHQALALLKQTQIYLADGSRKTNLIQKHWAIIDRCQQSIAYHKTSPWKLGSVKSLQNGT